MPIRCEIVSQDRMVFQGDVDIVVLPGTDGEMGILPHHAPLLTTLRYGYIKVRVKDQEEVFTVAGGVAEVQPNIVTVLADAAENVAEIDIERAESARIRAEEALKTVHVDEIDRYLALEAALRRSTLRLDAVKRYHTIQRKKYTNE
ncbi:MAG TPA: ATP synthase F1 subunit epsilon [Anaerolineales bacterium]|nr:ATP synthase F1 subunit epsilon [Anaerolineales bacterium]